MRILFLGSGPANPVRRKGETRTNSSLIVELNKKKVLIDCTPNFLEQVKREGIDDLDFVLISHAHYDAIGGLGDLDKWIKHKITVFLPPRVLSHERLKKDFKNLVLNPILPHNTKKVFDFEITPFRVIHAEVFWKGKKSQFPCYGYLINHLLYAEDMEKIPVNSEKYFEKAETIIIDAAMYFGKQIRGHLNTEQALQLIKQYNPNTGILIQAGHTYPSQKEAEKSIAKRVEELKIDSEVILAYDGLDLDLSRELETELAQQAFGSSGGKSRIVKKLIGLVPNHSIYVEPFAGGAAVYWNKEPVEMEVLNDKNSEIAFAYKFIKNATEEQVNKLTSFNWNPNKQTFFRLKDSEIPKDHISRFYRFYYVHAYSYGLSSQTYGYKTNKVAIFKRILKLKERMKNTEIYNTEYSVILKKYNSEKCFAYLDPPYPQEWAGPEGTKFFSKEDCQNLYDDLKNFKGKFLLSINNLDWIKDMFSNFRIVKIKVPRTFHKNDSPKYELLISNYDIKKLSEINENNSKNELDELTEKIESLNPLISQFKPIDLVHDFISLVGSTLKRSKEHIPNDIDLHMRLDNNFRDYIERAVKVRIDKMLKEKDADKVHLFSGDASGSYDTFLPLYHLALVPAEKKIVKMKQNINLNESNLELFKPYFPQKPKRSAYYDIEEAIKKIK